MQCPISPSQHLSVRDFWYFIILEYDFISTTWILIILQDIEIVYYASGFLLNVLITLLWNDQFGGEYSDLGD